jgi:uncharacterized protein (TIGR03067 family)
MHTLLLLAVLPSAPLDADKPKAPPKEFEKIQGIWKVTTMESSGVARAPTARTAARYVLVVVGDTYVLNTHAGTIALDLGKKTVDMKITEGRYKGQTLPGIFELSGDNLKIAFPSPVTGGERPKELKSGPDTSILVYTLVRDPKATREEAEAKLKDLRSTLATGTPARGTSFTPAMDRTTQDLLKQILEKLDRIEKRLDELEKKNKDK